MGKYFDILAYLMGKQAAGGGGGDVTVESKSISSNGTYTAPAGKAYSPVTVNVPNSYAAGDEGKVVSNGALVEQSSESVAQNGTVDTTLIKSLAVNVPAGTSFTLLAEQDFEVDTVSTTEISVGTIEVPGISTLYSEKKKWVWVLVRDKAGKQNGHYFGNDTFILGSTAGGLAVYLKSNGAYDYSSYQYGIYPKSTGLSQNQVYMKAKYASSFGAMSGTFHVSVYACDYPSGVGSLY